MTDTTTAVIFLTPWAVWLAWELVLLVLRARGRRVGTISMVARGLGWRINCLPYFWCGLAAHYWWNAGWGGTLTGVLFWCLGAVLFAADAFLWTRTATAPSTWPRWFRWLRWPLLWAFVGVAAGRFLFPQAGALPW